MLYRGQVRSELHAEEGASEIVMEFALEEQYRIDHLPVKAAEEMFSRAARFKAADKERKPKRMMKSQGRHLFMVAMRAKGTTAAMPHVRRSQRLEAEVKRLDKEVENRDRIFLSEAGGLADEKPKSPASLLEDTKAVEELEAPPKPARRGSTSGKKPVARK